MKLFVLFAMHRSGQHAVINWICRQHGNITNLNHVAVERETRRIIPHRPDHTKSKMVYGNGADLFINIESTPPERWITERWDDINEVKAADSIQFIVQVRRFRNWAASQARNEGMQIWYENLPRKEFWSKWDKRIHAYKHHLSIATAGGPLPDTLIVRFDDWFHDPVYRAALCERLDIPFTDAGIDAVSQWAGGSSFDGKDYDGKAREMNILGRWEEMKGTEPYDSFMSRDIELNDKSEALFAADPLTGVLNDS